MGRFVLAVAAGLVAVAIVTDGAIGVGVCVAAAALIFWGFLAGSEIAGPTPPGKGGD